MSNPSKSHKPALLTPCAGRCSTVFGDHVCRGCRRFNHEVIYWNKYSDEQKLAVWQRLDRQIDQILIPLLPQHDLSQVNRFLQHKRIRLLPNAGVGRRLYHALKLCEKVPALTAESGLGLTAAQVKTVWDQFETRVLALAQASYEVAWLRANYMQQHLSADDE